MTIVDKLFAAVPYEQLWQWGLTFCKNLIVAAIVYFLGRYLIKMLIKLFTKMLQRSKVDTTLYTFLNSIINVVLCEAPAFSANIQWFGALDSNLVCTDTIFPITWDHQAFCVGKELLP